MNNESKSSLFALTTCFPKVLIEGGRKERRRDNKGRRSSKDSRSRATGFWMELNGMEASLKGRHGGMGWMDRCMDIYLSIYLLFKIRIKRISRTLHFSPSHLIFQTVNSFSPPRSSSFKNSERKGMIRCSPVHAMPCPITLHSYSNLTTQELYLHRTSIHPSFIPHSSPTSPVQSSPVQFTHKKSREVQPQISKTLPKKKRKINSLTSPQQRSWDVRRRLLSVMMMMMMDLPLLLILGQ